MSKIAHLPESDKARIAKLVEELNKRKMRELAQVKFLAFVQAVWPGFIYGRHHARIAQEFEKVVNGECKRLIINLGPRHSKSEFGSYLLPAWFLGKYPHKKVIQCSHTAELAVGFGRKVRNLVGTPTYQEIFPGVELQSDSKAAGRWNTSAGGDYFAIGVGGAVTGKGADILIIDDPHSEQEAAIAASNPEVYDKVYEWYTSGPRQRLQPGGAIIIIQCMTGDTPVLMANGEKKLLKNIRPYDDIATYDEGVLSTAKVLNWQSNGYDFTYKIRMTSGIIVQANERHPFLVDEKGVRRWVRLKELKPGMSLVAMKDVVDRQEQKLDRGYVARAKLIKATINETLMRLIESSNTTASIKGCFVKLKGVRNLHTAITYVNHIITKLTGHQEKIGQMLKLGTQIGLKVGTVSRLTNTKTWLKSKTVNVHYVASRLQQKIQERIGMGSCVSTIAMIQAKLGRYYAMIVTLQLGIQKQKRQLWQSQSTSEFITDQIAEITFEGQAEVFDIQVAHTENFIANGLVSHNTRWSKRDLTGQVLDSAKQRGSSEWRVVELPAVLPSGKPLWPEFWSIQELEATRDSIDVSKWQAQYQQNPTSEEGAIIKREWWQRWPSEHPPATEFVLQTWDTAFEKTQRADYSACTTWGVFYRDDETGLKQPNIILLDAKRGRYEFPELKQVVLDDYNYWEPDSIVIEKKASGAPLIYELRAMGIPVGEFTPTRGNDKISRLNSVADIFASGRVWVPNTRFADEVVEEVAAFPAGQHDDYVDCVSLAMRRFRNGGFITTNLDKPDEALEYRSSRGRAYY